MPVPQAPTASARRQGVGKEAASCPSFTNSLKNRTFQTLGPLIPNSLGSNGRSTSRSFLQTAAHGVFGYSGEPSPAAFQKDSRTPAYLTEELPPPQTTS